MRRVVVTGYGAATAVGLDAKSTWNACLEGQQGAAKLESLDLTGLNVSVGCALKNFDPTDCMDAREARRSTRFVQVAQRAAKEAMEHAQLVDSSSSENPDVRFGCSIGVGIGAIDDIEASAQKVMSSGLRRVSPFFIPFAITNMAAGFVARNFGLGGPNICPATACTSGTHGIGEAFLYIRHGMADAMLAGGAEAAICPISIAGFANMKALSPNSDPSTASRPFDVGRDGFVIGEGAGVLVLEELERAKARGAEIIAEVKGYGLSGDAFHITAPPEDHVGAQRCMKAALKDANIETSEISYINAHGTSTPLNDRYESAAIKQVFGAETPAVSSTKGSTGHCLGAAGGIEAVLSVMAIQHGVVPHTVGLKDPDPSFSIDLVMNSPREMPVTAVLSNSFGFGGTNGSLVFGAL